MWYNSVAFPVFGGYGMNPKAHATSIRVILSNCVYLGQLVFGKTKCKGLYNKKRVTAPEDEWIVVENTHEPLVSWQLWDTVQKLMAT